MNRSLINCSFNQLPLSPQVPLGMRPHLIFSSEKIVGNILKFLPSMRYYNLVSKTFHKAASKLREEREWLIIKDVKTVR